MKSLREVHRAALFELMIVGDLHHIGLIAADLTGVSELDSQIVIDRAATCLILVFSIGYETLREVSSAVRSIILAFVCGHYALS